MAGSLGAELTHRLARRFKPNARADSQKVSAILADWQQVGGPRSGTDWLVVARLWVRSSRPAPASEALEHAVQRIRSPLLYLERARIAFLAGEGEAGAEHYWRGCTPVLGVQDAAEYWSDMLPLATPEEATRWASVVVGTKTSGDGDVESPCGFIRRFWSVRAAAASLSPGERVALHYRRLQVARERYLDPFMKDRILPSTGTGRTLATKLDRPRGIPFDDRGLVFLRMGEPDRTALFGGGVQYENVGAECFSPNESWAYDGPGGTRTFHFSPLDGVVYYRLLENLSDIYICGDLDEARTFNSSVGATEGKPLPFAGRRNLRIEQIAWAVLPELYLSRQGLDPGYATLAHRFASVRPRGPKTARADPAEAMGLQKEFHEERFDTWEDAGFAIQQIPDRPEVEPTLPFRYELLQFASTDLAHTRVWLVGEADVGGLTVRKVDDGSTGVRLEARLAVTSEDGTYELFKREFAAKPGMAEHAGMPFHIPVDMPPGRYTVTLVVTDQHSGTSSGGRPAGNYTRDTLIVRRFVRSLPELSSIVVSPDSGGSWVHRGVRLRPSPSHLTGRDGKALVYFEVTGLPPGGGYTTRIRLEPKKGEPFELRYTGTSLGGDPSGPLQTTLRIDFSESPPGRYEMTIVVEDEETGAATLPAHTFIRIAIPD